MKATLVVLAAGLGRRFGGDKQTAGVGQGMESLLEYAVYDAIQAGFSKVVFVIQPQALKSFRAAISNRFDDAIEVRFVFQQASTDGRTAPWGTGHALLSARLRVRQPFAVINADDFYGAQAYRSAMAALTARAATVGDYFLVGYRLVDTLSPHGPVSRGVLEPAPDGFLKSIEEHTEIAADGNRIFGTDSTGQRVELPRGALVSMNFWGLTPDIFAPLAALFAAFSREHSGDVSREFYLPDAIGTLVRRQEARVEVCAVQGQWFGITHRQDQAQVSDRLCTLTADGAYPQPLWSPAIDPEVRALGQPFTLQGKLYSARPYGNGLINKTWLAGYLTEGRIERYILQRINDHVFAQPGLLMDNMTRVIGHLQEKNRAAGGDAATCLNLVRTVDGKSCWVDSRGGCWRAFRFVEGSESFDVAQSPRQAYQAAAAFGRFQGQLIDLPRPPLKQTIAHFHDTPRRLDALMIAVENDCSGRLKGCQAEVALAHSREALGRSITPLLNNGQLPLRVVHNDTKLNNVLFDQQTGDALCVVDLDTVMPGTVLWDFGDLVRSATLSVGEDATDAALVSFDMETFAALTAGYLSTAGGWLTAIEKELLYCAGEVMALELGIRFLTDYLDGDRYFRTERDQQNLDRCRIQFALLAQMENRRDEMAAVVESCLR